jgi:Trk K+ transport system NAD-binding subunit
MIREGHRVTWSTAIYWTFQTMSTLGYGDVTFTSDLGRLFTIVVLLTGLVLLFVLVPFTLIQFVYAPWLEARNAARTPHVLPAATSGHVILTGYGPIEAALIERLDQFDLPYVVVAADTRQALEWHDQGVRVMVGALDDPDTYQNARVDAAALVVATRSDPENAVIALTVRQCAATVPIAATAEWEPTVELLERAGCDQVTQLGEMLGRAMARRIVGLRGGTLVIGRLDELLIAEASLAGSTFVGRTLREARLRERLGVTVVGLWERGRYRPGTPDTPLTNDMSVILSGTPGQLSRYNRESHATAESSPSALIVGGGRVGRAVSRHLSRAHVPHRIVERALDRAVDPSMYVVGDATDPAVLHQAGLADVTSVAITTHDDDVNAFLTLHCRGARADVQILSRAAHERSAATLYHAGANVVLSYVPMEANAIFDVLRHGSLWLAEGLETFTVPVPESMVGRSILASGLRERTGCHVLATRRPGGGATPPDISAALEAGTELVLIGGRRHSRAFFEKFAPAQRAMIRARQTPRP